MGIGLGGDYMIVPLMTAGIFGVQLLGRLLGVILTAGSVAELVSTWLVGPCVTRREVIPLAFSL
jgi:hypothetical protein